MSSYLDLIGCVAGEPLTVGRDPRLLRALATPSHASVADARTVLARWLERGAPFSNGGVHSPSFLDPRSSEFHGKFLRDRRFAPMVDASNADACGKCHAGTPTSGPAATPGATSCASCHKESEGVLACTTCHGSSSAGRAFPPRDACFFPGKNGGAHAVHLEKSESTALGVPCQSCHPVPGDGRPSGTHADGQLNVILANGTFDPSTRVCSTKCHAGPGALRPTPAWTDGPMKCGDCHAAPPPAHPAGACANCHSPLLHVNGKVDLGDGSGRCGACHGTGDDPRPKTGAHPKHGSPCENCHELDAKHPNGTLSVRFIGLATKAGRMPTFDPTAKTCAGTYCHDLAGGTARTPKWTETLTGCNSCHSSPPPPPHSTSSACGMAGCHLDALPPASTKHVNGNIDL